MSIAQVLSGSVVLRREECPSEVMSIVDAHWLVAEI